MGSKLSREELKSDSDLPRTSETKIRRVQSVRARSDFEQQHISLSPFLQRRNERQNKAKLVSSTVGRVQKSSDSQQVHNNLVSELREFQKLRQTPVSRPKLTDSLFIQPHVTVPQFNERLVAPNLRNSEIKSVKTEPTIVGNNLPPQLRKAPIPPPRIRSNNSESLVNKNSGQQSNIVMKDQRGNEVQQTRDNSSSGEKKNGSQQPNVANDISGHLNNELESETSDSPSKIVGNNLPQQLSKAQIPPPRIRFNNSESLVNKNSEQQSNTVMKDQRGTKVQQTRANSKSEINISSGEKKIESQQHLNNDSEPETSDSLREKCYDPKDTTLKFVDDEDTLDVLGEGFKSLRALMSCGHAVTPMSLTKYCHWLLKEGMTDFMCLVPGCGALWSFEEVCKMALLTPEEIKYFQKKMSDIKKSSFDVKSDQHGNEVPQTIDNSSAEEKKIESQQPNVANVVSGHLNNDSEPETSDSLHEKCYDPKDATLKFVDDEDTLDFLCEGFKSLRALMSCGHAVTPMSLTKYCHWLLKKGETDIVCGAPGCDHVWPLEEVCKMALLTPEETEYFEKKMFEIKKSWFDVKSCPGCKSSVLRADLSSLCVECTVCTADKKRMFFFCWQCLREWRGPSLHSDGCNNEGCTNQALGILKNCPEITFNDVEGVVGCPSIRACPRCGFLVGHDKTKCKYIVCNRCKNTFCFVCLKLEMDCLTESSFLTPCSNGVAPRQTSIPVPKR